MQFTEFTFLPCIQVGTSSLKFSFPHSLLKRRSMWACLQPSKLRDACDFIFKPGFLRMATGLRKLIFSHWSEVLFKPLVLLKSLLFVDSGEACGMLAHLPCVQFYCSRVDAVKFTRTTLLTPSAGSQEGYS